MVLSPTMVSNVPPDAAVAVVRAVTTEVSDAVVLLGVSPPRADRLSAEWPQLVWFNSVAARWFGLVPDHLEDREWFRSSFEHNQQLWLSLANVLREQEPARASVPFLLPSGETLSFDLTVTPLATEPEGRTRYWSLVAREELGTRAVLARDMQTRRLETLGLVAGSIAHDFANLVHVIGGYAELALRETRVDDARRAMTVVQDTATRAAALAKQLLQFSRQQPPQAGSIDLADLLRQLLPLLERLAGKRVALGVSLPSPPTPPRVWGHVGQLEQVLINLVVNAREAQPDGGRVHLAVDVLRASDVRPPMPVAEGQTWVVRLCVEDDGAGIPPALRDRVLDPFFTTKLNGTGLGLSTVADIVRQSRGALRLGEAAHLRGLRVDVLLPLYDGHD